MCDLNLTTLVAAIPALTTAYWACAIVGGGLALISAIGGSHADADVDLDVDLDVDVETDFDADLSAEAGAATDAEVDVDVDGHVADHADGLATDASSLATWFSIRFMVFFLAAFGVLGVVLTHMTQTADFVTLGISVAGGFVAGQGVHQLFRKLKQTSGNTAPALGDYVNQLARVTVPITHVKKGEITLNVRGGLRYVPALSKHKNASFDSGDEVAVVEYRGSAARVVSRKEFEFLNATQ